MEGQDTEYLSFCKNELTWSISQTCLHLYRDLEVELNHADVDFLFLLFVLMLLLLSGFRLLPVYCLNVTQVYDQNVLMIH